VSELKELVGDFEAVCEKWAAMNEMSDVVRTNILEIRSRALTSFDDVKLGMLGMFAEEPKRCDRQSAAGGQKESEDESGEQAADDAIHEHLDDEFKDE